MLKRDYNLSKEHIGNIIDPTLSDENISHFNNGHDINPDDDAEIINDSADDDDIEELELGER